ncbi:hypothetical protein GQ473_06495 [archaeon]|nr:hypothetical protein [archaeon]
MSVIIQCAECQMFSHISSSNCAFCGKNLLGDKARNLLTQSIPPLALVMITLFIIELIITLPLKIHNAIILFNQILVCLFVIDLFMDHGLHKFRMKTFFKKRTRDIIFVISAMGFLRILRLTKFGLEFEKYAMEVGKFAHTAEKGLLSAEKAGVAAKFRHDVLYAMPAVKKISNHL